MLKCLMHWSPHNKQNTAILGPHVLLHDMHEAFWPNQPINGHCMVIQWRNGKRDLISYLTESANKIVIICNLNVYMMRYTDKQKSLLIIIYTNSNMKSLETILLHQNSYKREIVWHFFIKFANFAFLSEKKYHNKIVILSSL